MVAILKDPQPTFGRLKSWKKVQFRPWSFKPVTDITGWYFFPVILFLLFPDKSIYSTSINWAIGNALMKPITDYKWQEQDYRKKMSACNVSYRLKRSGPKLQINSHLNYRRYSSNFCMAYVTVDMFMWIGEQGGYKSIKKGKSSSRNFLLNWKL